MRDLSQPEITLERKASYTRTESSIIGFMDNYLFDIINII